MSSARADYRLVGYRFRNGGRIEADFRKVGINVIRMIHMSKDKKSTNQLYNGQKKNNNINQFSKYKKKTRI